MKEVVCRSSRLNLANRKRREGSNDESHVWQPWAQRLQPTPDTPSQRAERIRWWQAPRQRLHRQPAKSSSLPIGDETCSKRALIPSKKSKVAPMIIHNKAISGFPPKANDVAMQPDIRLQHVIVLGICFFMLIFYFNFAMMVWSPVVDCPIFTHTSVPRGR